MVNLLIKTNTSNTKKNINNNIKIKKKLKVPKAQPSETPYNVQNRTLKNYNSNDR